MNYRTDREETKEVALTIYIPDVGGLSWENNNKDGK